MHEPVIFTSGLFCLSYSMRPVNGLTLPAFLLSCFIHCQSDRSARSTGNGIVYLSGDNGNSWVNKSEGLPDSIFLSDMAASGDLLGISTKQHGIFLYDPGEEKWVSTPTNPPTADNLDVLYFYHDKIFAGTQHNGIFVSNDKGHTWSQLNKGLTDLTIRRFSVIDSTLFVGTNGSLYSLNERQNKWLWVYGHRSLQVNGITALDNGIYIGTNQGIFKTDKRQRQWQQVMSNHALHNISHANKNIYALAYNELFVSADSGHTWQSAQAGIPLGKYSFHLVQKDTVMLVAQWDGVYRNDGRQYWIRSNNGLPEKLPITELQLYKNQVVIASSGWPAR